MTTPDSRPSAPDADLIHRRLDELERENARLRRKLEPIFGPDNPGFDLLAFGKAMRYYFFVYGAPMIVLANLLVPLGLHFRKSIPHIELLPGFPLIDPGGMYSGRLGIGFGLIAFGGLAVGVIAIGGAAIGVVAIGGGAFGLLAIGGGAVGFIAIGGGAVGYIAVGGGGYGYYVLVGDGAGKHVISRKRQDPTAIEFFTRYLPRLRNAFTGPMPVIPVETPADSGIQ